MKMTYIGRSKIAGRGILAGEDIKKGEYIMTLQGEKIHKKYNSKKEYRYDNCWVPIAINLWINPAPPIRFLNHSCDPSAGFKTPRRLYAMRDIKQGEEITADYSTIEYVDFWDMPCKCGAKSCRKLIKSIQHLQASLYHHYLPYIPRFLRLVRKKYKSRGNYGER